MLLTVTEDLTATIVKARARELGADLVGIAAAHVLNERPPDPTAPRTPALIFGEYARSVVVLGVRMLYGALRIKRWDDRQKQHAQELALSQVEEVGYGLVLFLESHGYPSITVPSMHTEYEPKYSAALSLRHASVEAGLGTLGLGGQLLTREFGPRVLLGGVVTSAPLEPDQPLNEPLCLGESCGRCLLACPANAIGDWELDKDACAPYASPYGYGFVQSYMRKIVLEPDPAKKLEQLASSDTTMIWQSVLRSVGAYTGCTRCLEVCPVGMDYEQQVKDAHDDIPEVSEAKLQRLDQLRQERTRGARPAGLNRQARWVLGPGATIER